MAFPFFENGMSGKKIGGILADWDGEKQRRAGKRAQAV